MTTPSLGTVNKFYSDNGANGVILGAPASMTADILLTLPSTIGTTGQTMKVDSAGVLSFGTIGVGGGGTGLTSGTSGGIPYFSAASTLASSAALTASALVVGGGAGTTPSTLAGTSGGVVYFSASNVAASSGALTASAIVVGGGAGAAPTTLAGTSGGVVYFSASNVAASSGALTASALVLGGGAGASPTSLALGTANYALVMNSGGTANTYALVATANLAVDTIQRATVSLTNANMATMYTTPVIILAAAGSGKHYGIFGYSLVSTYGTAAYTNGGNIGLTYGSVANLASAKCTTECGAGFLTTGNNQIYTGLAAAVATTTLSTISNAGIYISNATGEFTPGASTTTAKVYLSYCNLTE